MKQSGLLILLAVGCGVVALPSGYARDESIKCPPNSVMCGVHMPPGTPGGPPIIVGREASPEPEPQPEPEPEPEAAPAAAEPRDVPIGSDGLPMKQCGRTLCMSFQTCCGDFGCHQGKICPL